MVPLPLTHPKLQSLFGFWNRLRGARRMPARADFDVFDVREWLGHLHLVQVIEQGRDFRHLIYGTELAVAFAIDLTGKAMDAVPPEAREPLLSAYRDVVARQEPSVMESDPVLKSASWRVENLILPLSSDGVRVDRLLIGAYPVELADPTFPALPERRAEPRIAVLLSGMISSGAEYRPCVVLDASLRGAGLELDEPSDALRGAVRLLVDKREFAAQIAWQRERKIGIRFSQRLSAPLS